MKRLAYGFVLAILSWPSFAGQPDIVEISPNTYLLVLKNHAGIFGNLSNTKLEAVKDAAEFARKRGKVAIPLGMLEKPVGGPGHWPTIEYQFALADPSSEVAQSPHPLTPSDPTQHVEIVTANATPQAAPQPTQSPKTDLYAEMLKLDDLHKRGILSDAEFQQAKTRLLSGQ